MCLVKVREEEDVVVPYRRVTVNRPASTQRVTRYSRTSLAETPRPSSVRIPAPSGLQVPAPQPIPVFVQPPPSPPMPIRRTEAHYVEVSPHSSVTSHSDRHSDIYIHEHIERRERRDRDYSPARSDHSRADRDRYKTYQYVEAPETEYSFRRDRSRSRARSRSRDNRYAYEPRDDYRTTRERIVIEHGGADRRRSRSREYRR